MSELEKIQRTQYQKNRKKWITIQSVIACVLVLAALITTGAFLKMNSETYVYYTEKGTVNHKVYLENNSFYDEEYLDRDHAYVTSIIDKVSAEFAYGLQMDALDANYKYVYSIDGCLHITDKETGADLFDPMYTFKEETANTSRDNSLCIRETVEIDYHEYNDLAKSFVETYDLRNITAALVVTMHVNVVGSSEEFAQNSENVYEISLNIPLLKQTVNMVASSTVPGPEQKILACDSPLTTVFKTAAIITGILGAVALAILIVYVIRTRDNHIDYARKVAKLLSSYKSYIQRINNPFCFDGYQILHIATFQELLEIRDTLQIPVLMYENEDKTVSQFFIATTSGLMYLYVVCVEGFEDASLCRSAV